MVPKTGGRLFINFGRPKLDHNFSYSASMQENRQQKSVNRNVKDANK